MFSIHYYLVFSLKLCNIPLNSKKTEAQKTMQSVNNNANPGLSKTLVPADSLLWHLFFSSQNLATLFKELNIYISEKNEQRSPGCQSQKEQLVRLALTGAWELRFHEGSSPRAGKSGSLCLNCVTIQFMLDTCFPSGRLEFGFVLSRGYLCEQPFLSTAKKRKISALRL